MRHGHVITEEEADRLVAEGAGSFFDLPSTQCGGYFPPKQGNSHIVLFIEGEDSVVYSVRSTEDLEAGPDGVFVRFVEDDADNPLPSFDEAFQIKRL